MRMKVGVETFITLTTRHSIMFIKSNENNLNIHFARLRHRQEVTYKLVLMTQLSEVYYKLYLLFSVERFLLSFTSCGHGVLRIGLGVEPREKLEKNNI